MNFLKRLCLIATIPLFVFGILFSFPQYSRSYDDKTTHPGLTDEMVDFYNFSTKNKLTNEEKEWIVLGSINEDTEPRWINHFYDPIHNEGWKAENLGWIPSLALSVFSRTLLNINTETVSSKNWAHNEVLQAKYGNYWGNRTWENAIRHYVTGDKMFALQTLGDILHLLEDATVPDHTRNDTHVHEGTGFTTDGGSPYEDYAKDFTRTTLHTADDLIKENKQPIILDSLDAYFDNLAKYSNGYFFSKDTINSKKYANPKILREDDKYGYGKDENGNEFPLTKVSENFNKKKLIFETVYTLKDDNNKILPAYFSRLSREAVLNGAGVIKLFFDEVAKAEKDKSLIQKEPKASWWGEMRSPLYGVIMPTYNSVVGLISRVAATENSTNNNGASVILATTQNTQQDQAMSTLLNNTQQETSTNEPKTLIQEQQNASTTVSLPIQPKEEEKPVLLSSVRQTQTNGIVDTTPRANSVVKSDTSFISYGGGGGEIPQIRQETAAPPSVAYINGVTPTSFATTTLSSATTTFSGTYNNSAAFDKITFELKNISLHTATSSIVRTLATTTGEGLAYSEQIVLESEGNWQYRAQLNDSVSASSTPWSALVSFRLATSTIATTTPDVAPSSPSPAYSIVAQQPDHATFDTTSGGVQGYGIQRNVVLPQPVTFTGLHNGDQGRIVLWYYFGYGQDCSTIGSIILETGPADSTSFSPVSATPNWDGSCVFRLANANGSVTLAAQSYALFLYNSFIHGGPYAYGKSGGNSSAVYCRGGGIHPNSCEEFVGYSANLSDFAYMITSDTYVPPPVPDGTSLVPPTASPVAAEQGDHGIVDATTQPNIYPIQRNVVLSHRVTFTGANVGDQGRIIAWYSFAPGQDCGNVGMVVLSTGPADSTSFVPISKTPSVDGACVFHLGNANASVIKEAGNYALYMENSAYSLGVPRPLGKSGGNGNAVFCAGSGIYPSSCSDFRGYSANLSDFAYTITEDTYNMRTPSSARSIVAFSLSVPVGTVTGVIDEVMHTVNVSVPFGTNVQGLIPSITVSPLAVVNPASLAPQDFTNPVVYTVTAEDGTLQAYTVTVTIDPA